VSQPKLTDLPLWTRFEERALRVLGHALSLLGETENGLDELRLNRLLYACIADANRLINIQDGGGFEYLPSYNGFQAPDNVAEPPEGFEAKIPDFIWSLHDHTAASGLEGCREFVIECKRIGNERGGTNFNHRYVDQGIVRFVSITHKYGLRGESGAMVGYIQRSDHDAILAAIGERSASLELGEIAVSREIGDAVVELRQLLDRLFGKSPFALIHLWVDLRPAESEVLEVASTT
jgi:hypothetical protein